MSSSCNTVAQTNLQRRVVHAEWSGATCVVRSITNPARGFIHRVQCAHFDNSERPASQCMPSQKEDLYESGSCCHQQSPADGQGQRTLKSRIDTQHQGFFSDGTSAERLNSTDHFFGAGGAAPPHAQQQLAGVSEPAVPVASAPAAAPGMMQTPQQPHARQNGGTPAEAEAHTPSSWGTPASPASSASASSERRPFRAGWSGEY